jgi:hypothetical protein
MLLLLLLRPFFRWIVVVQALLLVASFHDDHIGVMMVVHAMDNGIALLPPMGWRSWNLYGGSIDQVKMTAILTGMVQRTRQDHTGQWVSLCDLGYCNVGLDDVWQACDSPLAAEGMHYHDGQGRPLVNLERFPSLTNMTLYGHALNMTVGWYANNCACSDHCRTDDECSVQIQQDVKALIDYGFDSIKIDGCGGEIDLVLWNQYLQDYTLQVNRSTPILVENCHGGDPNFKPNRTLPPALGCPYHYYRTSQDIRNNYGSIISNLGTMKHYRNVSYPGCWAYPDMLMVGVGHPPNNYGLTVAETRSHFAAWAIVSSPLILSHDVNDDEVTDRIWDIISNRDVLAVNQAYVKNDPGGVYFESNETVHIQVGGKNGWDIPLYQYHSKPLGGAKDQTAVLLLNSDNTTRQLTAHFADIPGLEDDDDDDNNNNNNKKATNSSGCCSIKTSSTPYSSGGGAADENDVDNKSNVSCKCGYEVYDVWTHQSLGVHMGSWSVQVGPHDAAFVLVHRAETTAARTEQGKGVDIVLQPEGRGGGGNAVAETS